jgi:hypothetical protein
MRLTFRLFIAAGLLLPATSLAGAAETSLWRVTFDTRWLGPMEAHVGITRADGELRGVSRSGAAAVLAELPGDHQVDDGLMVFEATETDGGELSGSFLAPWQEGKLTLKINGDALEGSVEGGAFAGTLSGRRVERAEPIRDYRAVLQAFDSVVAGKVFDPADLDAPGYRRFRDTMDRVVDVATDDLDVLFGFHLAWQNDPFSHFQLRRSAQTAEQMFAYFDSYRVGFEAATVEIDGDTAILKVRTMMGADTIEQIEAAFDTIAAAGCDVLVIDLRGNTGGAFAVKPLVEHVIDEPLEAGFFLSQVWTREHDAAPTREEVLAAPLWSGWSIVSFWQAVQERGITRVRFNPAEPNFDGEVYVLVDGESASATEMAADALRASGLATLVGERTAGEMLSQSLFDVTDGFIVSLPVADYYSIEHGRIEAVGVPVDVEASSAAALDVAREMVSR